MRRYLPVLLSFMLAPVAKGQIFGLGQLFPLPGLNAAQPTKSGQNTPVYTPTATAVGAALGGLLGSKNGTQTAQTAALGAAAGLVIGQILDRQMQAKRKPSVPGPPTGSNGAPVPATPLPTTAPLEPGVAPPEIDPITGLPIKVPATVSTAQAPNGQAPIVVPKPPETPRKKANRLFGR